MYFILLDILFFSTFLGGVRGDESPAIDYIRFVRIGVIILLFLWSMIIRLKRKKFKIPKAFYVYFLFICYSFITTFWAPEPYFALWKIFELTAILSIITLRFDFSNLGSQEAYYNRFVILMMVAVIGVLLTGFIFPEEAFEGMYNSIINFRLHGSLYSMNSNDLGFWSGLLVCLTISRVNRTFIYKSLFFTFLVILVLSQSRIFIVLTFMYLVFHFIAKKRYMETFISALSFVIIMFSYGLDILLIITRGDLSQVYNLHGRTYYWKLGYEAFVDNWLIGNGFYTGHRFLYMIDPNTYFSASTFDNTWIDILVDTGVIGFFIFIVFLFASYRGIRNSSSFYKNELNIGFFFLFVRSFFGPSFETFSPFLIYLLLISLVSFSKDSHHYLSYRI